jgi:hypothetical protein
LALLTPDPTPARGVVAKQAERHSDVLDVEKQERNLNTKRTKRTKKKAIILVVID